MQNKADNSFKYDAKMYYNGEKYMTSANEKLSDIYQACKDKWTNWGSNFEYKKELNQIIDDIFEASSESTAICNTIEEKRHNIYFIDSKFENEYIQISGAKFDKTPLESQNFYDENQYIEEFLDYCERNQDYLTPEAKAIYAELKIEKEKRDELAVLYVQRERNSGIVHPIIEIDLNKRIKELEKELGIYENKWYDDIGASIKDTASEWKEGCTSLIQGEGFGEILDATKKTAATLYVARRSIGSGLAKLGEWIVVDSLSFLGGSIAAGVTWLIDHETGANLMDGTLDFVRRDLVGEANQHFYENTTIGQFINENSTLKYDSAGARGIQTASEFLGKFAIATAATIASGGTAAPLVIGAMYGIGSSIEKYTQSVDRANGESYNYLEAFGRTTAGGIAGAAEFYGYGQMGAGLIETNIPSNASTSFWKNFLTRDTILDSAATIADHGVNVLTGDESWQRALLLGGAELTFALGLSAAGAWKTTKAVRAQNAINNIYYRTDIDFDDPVAFNAYLDSLSPEQRSIFIQEYYKNGSAFNTPEATAYLDHNELEADHNKLFSSEEYADYARANWSKGEGITQDMIEVADKNFAEHSKDFYNRASYYEDLLYAESKIDVDSAKWELDPISGEYVQTAPHKRLSADDPGILNSVVPERKQEVLNEIALHTINGKTKVHTGNTNLRSFEKYVLGQQEL